MKKLDLYRIIFIMLIIFIGMAIITVILGVLSMGGNSNPKQVDFNIAVNTIVGFPIQLFKDDFPLLLSNREFWNIQNLILVFINTLIQSFGIFYVMKYITKRNIR